MDLLIALIKASEKAANIARIIRQNNHLFELLVQKKSDEEANPRFIDDFKTLADVLIQEMVKHDIGNSFPQLQNSIFGEESNKFSNKLGETITVEIKETEDDTSKLLETVLNGDKEASQILARETHRDILLENINTSIPDDDFFCFDVDINNMGVWIDPIDSTAEYINGVDKINENGIFVAGLRCVTVLIGVFDRQNNEATMGVINQPFLEEFDLTWRGRCIWGIKTPKLRKMSLLPTIPPRNLKIILSSSENPAIKLKLMSKYQLFEAAGAGYKILTVILGQADAYILSKASTFKWDTCGPHAILKALGGDIGGFETSMKSGEVIAVKYYERGEFNCNSEGIIAFRNIDTFNDILTCVLSS